MNQPTTDKVSEFAYHVVDGMPPIKQSNNVQSRFEFWPAWLIYFPVVVCSLFWAIRYRSFTLPLLCNPTVHLAGLVGSSKAEILNLAVQSSQPYVMDWIVHERQPGDNELELVKRQMQQKNLEFPVVGKPDIGCRGLGVKLLKDEQQLADYLDSYPQGSKLMLQKLAPWEPEAGIFYVRLGEEERGKIISLGMKYSPYVVGDGTSTLSELMDAHPRVQSLKHLYTERHQHLLDQVIEKDQPFRLIFSAAHSKGAIFCDANEYITEAMTDSIDCIMKGFPKLNYGRLDVKFSSIERLQQGKDIAIVEINGANAEPLHIWDKDASLMTAMKALIYQYGVMFKIGNYYRKQGFRPPGIKALREGIKTEFELYNHYPSPD